MRKKESAKGLRRAIGRVFDRTPASGGFLGDDDAAGIDAFELSEMSIEAPSAPAEQYEEPLSALVLRQKLDGSFAPRGSASPTEATIEALGLLLDAGNTDVLGPYRQAVAKAVTWLLGRLPTLAGDERIDALAVLRRWVDLAGTPSAQRRLEAAAPGA